MNAFEAMRGASGGSRELLISASKTERGGVLIAVRDSGPGLDPAVLGRLQGRHRGVPRGALGPHADRSRTRREADRARGPL